jgi:hypothetical protein
VKATASPACDGMQLPVVVQPSFCCRCSRMLLCGTCVCPGKSNPWRAWAWSSMISLPCVVALCALMCLEGQVRSKISLRATVLPPALPKPCTGVAQRMHCTQLQYAWMQ